MWQSFLILQPAMFLCRFCGRGDNSARTAKVHQLPGPEITIGAPKYWTNDSHRHVSQ